MKRATGILMAFLILLGSTFDIQAQNMFRKVSDYDGDGKADFAVLRVENGLLYWWIWQSSAGVRIHPWGLVGNDIPAAGDYDGDGKTDLAVWRRPHDANNSVSDFFVLESQTGAYNHKTFSNFTVSTPVHQDYNGDGRTDMGVTTGEPPSYSMKVIYSGSNTILNTTGSGQSVRLGDMDGDGRADQSSIIFDGQVPTVTIRNLVTDASRSVRFGLIQDMYQMADFDGDGIGDLTIWRSSDSTWWWIRSSDNVVNAAQWGIGSEFPFLDWPVPADYDGDGKTDLAVYRRSGTEGTQNYFWVRGSQNGVMAFAWGSATDQAVPGF